MKPTILLFDVDGTLISTGGAGRRAFERALALVCGAVPGLTGFDFAGMTDRAITRKALQIACQPDTEQGIDAVLAAYLEILPDEVASASRYLAHAGVCETLDALDTLPGIGIGLGTGNLEPGAKIKLARVGLDGRFAFGGFGSDHEDRAALLRTGVERGARRLGVSAQACRVVIVGDTPRDVAAAKAIGAESLAVATSHFDVATLERAGASLAVPELSHPAALPFLRRAA